MQTFTIFSIVALIVGGAGLAGCADGGGGSGAAACVPTGAFTPRVFRDRAAFDEALGAAPRLIDFDDVDASGGAVAIAPDRYAATGARIRGTAGQFVGQDFGDPGSMVPSSPPNGFAPGPQAPISAPNGTGGHDTDVTFEVGGVAGCVAGFGAMFIDVDFPSLGPSSLTAFGGDGARIGEVRDITGANAEAVFAGVVFFDDATGQPVSVVSRVHLVSGNSWAGVDAGEGVMLDDFVFPAPVVP